MRRKIKRQSYHGLNNTPWNRAYYWIGYNSKTNTISSRLRSWRNKKKNY